jgi:hypothetical protein
MLPQSKHVDVTTFSQTISNKYLMNSYKLYWLAGIIEEVKIGNRRIHFKRIVSRMIIRSWYSLLKFRLHFGYQDRLYVLVQYVHQISSLKDTASNATIMEFLKTVEEVRLDRLIRNFYSFVPYRFLSPFYYNELRNVPEKQRNNTLAKLSNSNPKFYSINDEYIELLDEWFKYIYDNQVIIEGWLNLRLVTFLQKRNPNTPSISEKLYAPK